MYDLFYVFNYDKLFHIIHTARSIFKQVFLLYLRPCVILLRLYKTIRVFLILFLKSPFITKNKAKDYGFKCDVKL